MKEKGATLHQMGVVLVSRGDLDGAMKLFQQALDIYEGIGYLSGKASTLRWIASIESQKGNLSSRSKIIRIRHCEPRTLWRSNPRIYERDCFVGESTLLAMTMFFL